MFILICLHVTCFKRHDVHFSLLEQVLDGEDVLATLCGNGTMVVEGISDSVKIVFTTDTSVTGMGWTLNWYSKYIKL